jgi:hypothetical protein
MGLDLTGNLEYGLLRLQLDLRGGPLGTVNVLYDYRSIGFQSQWKLAYSSGLLAQPYTSSGGKRVFGGWSRPVLNLPQEERDETRE